MVTAFFGKKPAPAPASARASKPAASSPAASGKKSPPPAELSSISFTGDSEYELGSADQVQVQEAGSGVGAAYEEAAVLYANGDVREAEAVLDNVLQAKEASSGEGLWMMLLDLYRLTGQKERFESRVLDYATRFERSPPAWLDLSSPGQRMQRRETVPLINLAGSLNAQAAEQCSQIRVIAERSGAIRIDLKRVRNFDEEGCHLLLSLITHLKRERVRVTLINAGHLAEMISGQIVPCERRGQEIWLLLLELLQHTGEFERFENVAVDYAVTFEESPPSWEGLEQMSATELRQIEETEPEPLAGVMLEGELLNGGGEGLRKLAAAASEQNSIEVECMELRRMDFVSAGTLFNILSTLRSQGKNVKLLNVNAMVAALLRVMGVDQVAQVMLRN